MRYEAGALREVLNPESLLALNPSLFDISDREEIEATQRTLGRTKAVDRMLYKVIRSQDMQLYRDFSVALEGQQNTTKGKVLRWKEALIQI